MPLSKDPAARANQLANLKPTAPTKHGARSEEHVRPLRERFLAELAEAFPSATDHELRIQAQRLAQMELYGAFIDERGVIRHRRRGEIFPAAKELERLAASFERQQTVLLEREFAKGKKPASSLAAILAEYTGNNGEATS